MFSLDITGYLDAFAVRDRFIAVSDPWGYDPVRVFSYTAAGEPRKVAEVDAFNVKQMDFISHYLVILSYAAHELAAAEVRVADFSDPTDPDVVYYLEEQWARGSLIHGETVLVGPFGHSTCMPLSYTAIGLSDPGNPVYIGRMNSDSWLLDAAGESHAVGCYCPQGRPCYRSDDLPAVLERTPAGAWETVATLSRYWCTEGGVHAPPYFVLGSCLWRLRDR